MTKTTIATALAALALTGCMTVGSVPTEATRVQYITCDDPDRR
jgi:hypothetical protein